MDKKNLGYVFNKGFSIMDIYWDIIIGILGCIGILYHESVFDILLCKWEIYPIFCSHVYCKWGKSWQANFEGYPKGAIRIVDSVDIYPLVN